MERNTKLETARRLRGWTLEAASQKIGVHPSTLRRWELGKSRPGRAHTPKLSQVYEMAPDDLGIDFPPVLTIDAFEAGKQSYWHSEPLFEQFVPTEGLDTYLLNLTFARKRERQNRNYGPFQFELHQRIKEYDEHMRARQDYDPEDPSRLQALRLLATMPLAAYSESIDTSAKSLPPEDMLTFCAGGITACWHLSGGQDLNLASSLVSGYLLLLIQIFERTIHCRAATAELIAQAYLLSAMLALQVEDLQSSVNYYARALEYSKIAEYPHIQSPRATDATPAIHCYGKQPARVLEQMAEAIWLLKPPPMPPEFPLVHDYLRKLAELDEDETRLDFPDATRLFSHPPEPKPETRSIHFSLDYPRIALMLWNGITYHELREYARALDELDSNNQPQAISDAPELMRLEFLHNRALAALRLHDMNQAVSNLRASIPQAIYLGNEQELLQTHRAYHILQFLQPGEATTTVEELKDLFKQHD